MVPPSSDRITRVPPYSFSSSLSFRVRDFHSLWLAFPDHSTTKGPDLRATPRSLAATKGISVDFFSSGYLDVSVPRVRLSKPIDSAKRYPQAGGFPHSEMFGSQLVYQLPEPYRRLLRPSSPLTAKASTVHACSLDHITRRRLVNERFVTIIADWRLYQTIQDNLSDPVC